MNAAANREVPGISSRAPITKVEDVDALADIGVHQCVGASDKSERRRVRATIGRVLLEIR